MNVEDIKCPECGEPPVGTLETMTITGVALFNDSLEWCGDTDIELDYDAQETVERDGLPVLVCDQFHEWTDPRVTFEVCNGIEKEAKEA